ncbi:hypothetical protein GUITHDRAFT_144699 [Guillardia theta CCMP2712]|uniref:Cdc23 domain-containing protein n=1 Tax=Guillardia theta (strain CCMP2712) TaxID=905079 RepID=L1IP92_GUITC|nr:hypothetical protein GUITHDRAFT_144699 [Guillardia theta CCMP2712]EKX37877.1 hypothetical protein GUITHDRAFT_144699 [Guillardia theta CCMP2712]|eukprot:XP_005824857.1 hypothetical protein GUITHDRAFT_144699 [Guillardia theta CCMP2712]
MAGGSAMEVEEQPQLMKGELRLALKHLSEHGLLFGAKWAAEQLNGFASEVTADEAAAAQRMSTGQRKGGEEEDLVDLAKTYVDVKEYKRAAYLLRECRSSRGVFLRGYATYLSGQKRKQESEIDSSAASAATLEYEAELSELHKELARMNGRQEQLVGRCGGELDGFCLFLYGMVLKALDLEGEARKAFQQSVRSYPWNWGAWLELASLCHSQPQLQELSLPDHWMKNFFLAHMDLELQSNKQALARYLDLQRIFPHSLYIMALAQYNMREFNSAQSAFEQILSQDPYRLDNIDTYSNILYVKEEKTKLRSPLLFGKISLMDGWMLGYSFVAHSAMKNEKYRPETCCIVALREAGNYYSLKGQHEKAVLYFKRALQLDSHYLSAWTLMGHEYVEIRNTAAAIEAYRRALDINSRDYRAWYGLGQTYEILQMHFYSLHYFRCAMGQCYECLDKYPEAIKEGMALNKLGRLYAEKILDLEQAALHYENNLRILDSEQVNSQQTIDALLFLARYFRNPSLNRLDDAEIFCQRLLESEMVDREEVTALMREIRQISGVMAGHNYSLKLCACRGMTQICDQWLRHPNPFHSLFLLPPPNLLSSLQAPTSPVLSSCSTVSSVCLICTSLPTSLLRAAKGSLSVFIFTCIFTLQEASTEPTDCIRQCGSHGLRRWQRRHRLLYHDRDKPERHGGAPRPVGPARVPLIESHIHLSGTLNVSCSAVRSRISVQGEDAVDSLGVCELGSCRACHAGTYQDETAQAGFGTCKPSSHSNSSAESQSIGYCLEGYQAGPSTHASLQPDGYCSYSLCYTCPLGYKSDLGNLVCTSCPAGSNNGVCQHTVGSNAWTWNLGWELHGLVYADVDECLRGSNSWDVDVSTSQNKHVSTSQNKQVLSEHNAGNRRDGKACVNKNEGINVNIECKHNSNGFHKVRNFYWECRRGYSEKLLLGV